MERQDLRKRLEELVADPEESMSVEIKCWLNLEDPRDRAHVAKEAMALANYGGGFILFGFVDKGVPPQPAPRDLNLDLDDYNQDAINAAVRRFADPPFHCSVKHVAHPETGEIFPVVVVPGAHTTFIKAKRDSPDGKLIQKGKVYTRKPGAISEPASPEEIVEIWARCSRVGHAAHPFPSAPSADGTGSAELDVDPAQCPAHNSGPIPLTETRHTSATREELQKRITADQRAVLNAIWTWFRDRREWIPRDTLYLQFRDGMRSAGVQAAHQTLADGVVWHQYVDTDWRYGLTVAGVLLTDQGREVESLLAGYLEYVRDRVRKEPTVKQITSDEVSAALGLSPEQVALLGRILPLSPFEGGGSRGETEWSVQVPRDVYLLAEADDVHTYLWEQALANVGWEEEIQIWEGIDWKGGFIAWDGPLGGLDEKEPVPYDPDALEEMKKKGYDGRFGRNERIPERLKLGYRFAYETDRRSWKRKIEDGPKAFLMVRRET